MLPAGFEPDDLRLHAFRSHFCKCSTRAMLHGDIRRAIAHFATSARSLYDLQAGERRMPPTITAVF
jgi:hypothetical protein